MMPSTSTILLFLILLSFYLPSASNQIIAYYSFDSGSLQPSSTSCPLPPYLSSASMISGNPPVYSIDNPPGTNFDVSLSLIGPDYLSLGVWRLASSSYSIAAWIKFVGYPAKAKTNWPFIIKGPTDKPSWSLAINGKTPQVKFLTSVSTGGKESVTANVVEGVWVHMVAIFDNVNHELRLHINGATAQTQSLKSTQSPFEDNSAINIGSIDYEGFIDELYFFDHALTMPEVSNLYGRSESLPYPVVLMPAPFLLGNGESGNLSVLAVSGGDPLSYTWSVSGSCANAKFSSPNSYTTNVTITGDLYETYRVRLNVMDTVTKLCNTGSVDITLDATFPRYDKSQSSPSIATGELVVPYGQIASVTVVLEGSPMPTIKWQELLDVASARAQWKTPRHPLPSDVDADWLHGRVMATQGLCNDTANFTTNCSEWLDIANQTSATYTTPVGDSLLQGTQIRFVASNSKGIFVSDPITLSIESGPPSDGDGNNDGGTGGGGSDPIGAIVGPILGLSCACMLLCCLILTIVAVLRLLKHRRDEFPGNPPNYDEVIFGPYLEPMYKIKSRHINSLERLEKMLISDPQYGLLAALANASSEMESEKMARLLVYILHPHQQCLPAMQVLVKKLLEETTDPKNALFKANTMETRMFKYFAILVAAPYLWETFALFIWELQRDAWIIDNMEEDEEMGTVSTSSFSSLSSLTSSSSSTRRLVVKSKSHTLMNTGMEIDPSKMDEAADPKVNTLQLWLTAQKIFSAITRSTDDMPKELIEFLLFIHNEVKQAFPGEEYKAMGGFLFLRFICPSLLTPHVYGLLDDPPSPTAQRQYILIGKVLQNLANTTLPSSKEEYMNKLNHFITTNQDDLMDFYDTLMDSEFIQPCNRQVSETVKQNALAELYNLLLLHATDLEGELQEMGSSTESGEGEATSAALQELRDILSAGPIESTADT